MSSTFEEPHRFLEYPHANATGIVDIQMEAGDSFKEGDTLALIRSLDGRVLSEIKADLFSI